MPFRRFLAISHFLHFSNNREREGNDRMGKVRTVVTYLNNRSRQLCTTKCDVIIDDSLTKYKGRLSFTQFNPPKRARFGIKFYKISESESGYSLGFKIYIGQVECSDSKKSTFIITITLLICSIANGIVSAFIQIYSIRTEIFQFYFAFTPRTDQRQIELSAHAVDLITPSQSEKFSSTHPLLIRRPRVLSNLNPNPSSQATPCSWPPNFRLVGSRPAITVH